MARKTWTQSQVKSYQRLKKCYLMPPCLNTQHYKVQIKGKVEQSRVKWSIQEKGVGCWFLLHITCHLPPITKTSQVRWTRPAGHCWRSRDELISDVLRWTPSHGRAKAGRPARTYIQQLRGDTGCSPEDLPDAMNDRERWRERVRDIRADGTTRWWWRYINPC